MLEVLVVFEAVDNKHIDVINRLLSCGYELNELTLIEVIKYSTIEISGITRIIHYSNSLRAAIDKGCINILQKYMNDNVLYPEACKSPAS